MVETIARPDQLEPIMAFVGAPMVKVLTGIRRGGKSTLLQMIADKLAVSHSPEQVILLNFEKLSLSPLLEQSELKRYLDAVMVEDRTYCVLLDEIQDVEGWERVVNSLLAEGRADLYITGSNSRLLSSELATHIAGRYVEFEVQTLSFAEHLRFIEATTSVEPNPEVEFRRYLMRGGFPGTYAVALTDEQVYRAVSDIYTSALVHDVLTRKAIRNPDMLRRVALFALDNIGSPYSAASVAKYLKSQRRQLDPDTALNYLGALSEAFVFSKAARYDLQGKRLLTINEKYYAGDHGLVSALLGASDRHLSGILENVVWAELRRRGHTVHVGKIGQAEVDFVAERQGQLAYFQIVSTFLDNPATRQRELAPLQAINDSFPRYVLSLEPVALRLEGGVTHQRIPDFLLGNELR
jgi:predicted AAA+ superfamily ATPase